MDRHLILEFSTQAEAEAALAIINEVTFSWWQSQGYEVEDGELIGKNAKTGVNAHEKAHTTTWAEVQESPDETYYFASLSNDARFCDWRDYLPDGTTDTMPEDKEFPESWVINDEYNV